MKNRIFMKKSVREKRRYLVAFLKSGAGGSLHREMIRKILPAVSFHKQYTVSVFSDGMAYRDAVRRARNSETLRASFFPPAGHGSGQASAAVVTATGSPGGNAIRAIYIYAPKQHRKGMKKWVKSPQGSRL